MPVRKSLQALLASHIVGPALLGTLVGTDGPHVPSLLSACWLFSGIIRVLSSAVQRQGSHLGLGLAMAIRMP